MSQDYTAHDAVLDEDYGEHDGYMVEKILAQRPNASGCGGVCGLVLLMRVSLGVVTWVPLGVWFAVAGHSPLRAARGRSQQAVCAPPGAHTSVQTATVW